MTLRLDITLIVLFAALLHASWNAVVKSGEDRLVALASINLVGAVVAGCLLAVVGLPQQASWGYLGLSVLLHLGYYLFLVRAYAHGDLSHVYPLARGSAPLLVAMGAAVFAAEWLSWQAMLGITIACVGIISLAFDHGVPWREDAPPLRYAFGTSFWIAAYTITDGLGVRASGNPPAYIAWLFFLDGVPISLYALYRRQGKIGGILKRQWVRYLTGGVAMMGAYGLVIYAMNSSSMGMVSALRETSVIMATIIGAIFLKERFGWQRLLAACLVTSGVILLQMS